LYNHLNTQTGDTLSNQWWIYATEFSNGVAVVHKRSVQNFLLKNGKFLLKHWYPIVLNDKGLLIVYNNANKFNFADITFPDIVLYNRWFSVESEYDEIIERERAKLAKELAKQNKKSR
ncbi:MAG: hypothetical protein JW812_01595, partial [Alphaproteobacteria bacterium]|nr:hypothetical protein [Alphaproteobacteria bacterium]